MSSTIFIRICFCSLAEPGEPSTIDLDTNLAKFTRASVTSKAFSTLPRPLASTSWLQSSPNPHSYQPSSSSAGSQQTADRQVSEMTALQHTCTSKAGREGPPLQHYDESPQTQPDVVATITNGKMNLQEGEQVIISLLRVTGTSNSSKMGVPAEPPGAPLYNSEVRTGPQRLLQAEPVLNLRRICLRVFKKVS